MVCYCGAEQAILKFSDPEYWCIFQGPSKAPFSWTTCAWRRNCPAQNSPVGHTLLSFKGGTRWSLSTQTILWSVTLPAHRTPQLLCSVVHFGTKAAAARAAYIIPCISFFGLVSVMSNPAKKWPQHILAGGGWESPGGSIHMPHVWPSRGEGATPQPGPQGGVPLLLQPWAVGWKQSIKGTKGTGWDLHILNGHPGGSASKNNPKRVRTGKTAKRQHKTKKGF